ncbi:hypothetical protein [Methanomethylovorans sp.]|uniref:hypothetical protein n=1 Tax=Methanomethylovorans sp. TaxID=2758717 RepID=UPI00351CADC2
MQENYTENIEGHKPMCIDANKIHDARREYTDGVRDIIEVVKQFHETDKKARKIRGDIVAAIIDLDDIIEEMILKKYVKTELHDEFRAYVLNQNSCSSSFKYEIVNMSGLLDKNLKEDILRLFEIRDMAAHFKYKPTVDTVEIFRLHKNETKNIQSLKKEFDSIFKNTMTKMKEVLRDI